jgi:hypothetical protein
VGGEVPAVFHLVVVRGEMEMCAGEEYSGEIPA